MSTTTATPMIGTYNADPVHSSLGFSILYQGFPYFAGRPRSMRPSFGHEWVQIERIDQRCGQDESECR